MIRQTYFRRYAVSLKAACGKPDMPAFGRVLKKKGAHGLRPLQSD
ncbi:hypothetical protein Q675_25740 [Labrenzia sp. C1B70]|nr:hypothetical protein Q675_25740 [Labrenzia sp. C1B70]